jgi:hypothetical protein
MQVGSRAQGQEQYGKMCVIRHGRSAKRGLNAQEKVFETKVRRSARKEIRDQLRA